MKSDFWAAGEKLWAASLPVVRAHLATTESEVPGHTLATTVLARALTSPPGRQAVPNPSNRVLSAEAFPAPSAAIQPRSRMPWDLTVLAAVNSFALRFIKHSIAFIVPFVGFKLAIDYWTGPSRWLALLGGAMLFINLLVCLPLHLGLELLLSRLKRVGNGFAGLARQMDLERAKTSPGRVEAESVTARRKGVFSEAIRFASRAGQEKPDESLAKERESYLCFLIAQGFDTVADDPREAARTIMAIIEIGGGSIDALIAALVNVEGAKLEASFGEIISTWSYRKISDKKPVLRVFVSIAHQLPDPGFLAEFIAFVELGPTKYSAEFQEQVGLLHMLPPESLAIATLASVGDQGSGRLTDPGPAWRRRLRVVVGEYLGEFGSGAGRRMNTLLQLPLRLGSIALSLLGAAGELIVGKPLRLVSQIRDPYGLSMLPEGHDPAQWRQEIARVFAQSQIAPRLRGLMAPLETSRIKESILAQSVIRKESPPGPVDSPRMFRRVLDRLSRGHLLASRSELVLTCMGDRDLLKAATDLSGQAGRSGDQSGMDRTTEQKDQQDQKDRDQLHRILPLKSIGASYGLLIVLSFLGNLVWLGALWSVAPSGVRTWLFPYGLVEGLAISICCASVQCLPNAIYLWDIVWRTRVIYYRILMCLVSPVIIWLIHQHVSDAAQSAGVAIPGSDYGWSGLHLLIPLIPILITNLLVPEWIAWWRGSCLLYPSDLRLRLSRLGSASVCVGLFVLCGFFVFGLSRMLPAEPASLERGSLHGIVATVQKLRVEDKAIPAPIGGHAGISRLYEIDLKVDPAENAEDRTLTRAFTRRVIRWPRNTEGVEVTGAIGQWFIPRRGQKVRLFLERRQNQNHTFADVAVPNGIDLITDPAQTFNGPQPVPSDDETSPLDPRQPMSFWEWLKMMAVFGLLFGVLPWIGIMFVPRIVSRIRRHLAGGAGNR